MKVACVILEQCIVHRLYKKLFSMTKYEQIIKINSLNESLLLYSEILICEQSSEHSS